MTLHFFYVAKKLESRDQVINIFLVHIILFVIKILKLWEILERTINLVHLLDVDRNLKKKSKKLSMENFFRFLHFYTK